MDVLIKYLDGGMKRGTILSFNINQPTFFLQVKNETGKIVSSRETLDSIQQILFLKKDSAAMSPVRTEKIGPAALAGTTTFRLTVELKDGAVITGTSHKYDSNERGFYLVPLNPADRSERIFITAQAVKRIESAKFLGKILVDQNKITQAQLEEGLKRQKELREIKLGTILQERNIISNEQLRESLQKQQGSRQLLGEILLQAGYITPAQLDFALGIQQEHRKVRLGQILVELKFLTPNDICVALATQLQCAWVDLSEASISPETAASLPAEVVRRLEVVPVEKRGDGVLVVASAEPQRPDLVKELSKATPLKVELAVAYEVFIARIITRSY